MRSWIHRERLCKSAGDAVPALPDARTTEAGCVANPVNPAEAKSPPSGSDCSKPAIARRVRGGTPADRGGGFWRCLGGGLARALLVLLLVLAAAGARAGVDPAEWSPVASDPRSYESVKARFADALAVSDYPAVFLGLQAEAEAVPWRSPGSVHERLVEALRVLNERLSHFNAYLDRAPDEAAALDAFLADFPTGLFQRQNEAYFQSRPFEVSYARLESLPTAQGEDFLYRADTAQRLLWDLKAPALRETLKGIRHARERWDLFVEKGMSQYPWEAVANGWVGDPGTIQVPPRRQWVLVHPELGVEVSTQSLRDLRAKESLLIEVLGHVWYRWKKGDPGEKLRWWGVSAAATLRDDLRPGVGLVAHYGKLVTLGVVWHDEDEDGDWFDQAPYAVLGLDLFRFVEDRAPAYQKRWQRALEVRESLAPGR